MFFFFKKTSSVNGLTTCSDYIFHFLRDSWKKLGAMSKQEALELYIQRVFETDPEWEAKYAVTDDLVGNMN